jgi:hypothetical protein
MRLLISLSVQDANVMDTQTNVLTARDYTANERKFVSANISLMDQIAKSVCRSITIHLGDARHQRVRTNANLATVTDTQTNASSIVIFSIWPVMVVIALIVLQIATVQIANVARRISTCEKTVIVRIVIVIQRDRDHFSAIQKESVNARKVLAVTNATVVKQIITISELTVVSRAIVTQMDLTTTRHRAILKLDSVHVRITLKDDTVANVNLVSSTSILTTSSAAHLAFVMVTHPSVKAPTVIQSFQQSPTSTRTKRSGQRLMLEANSSIQNTTHRVKASEW